MKIILMTVGAVIVFNALFVWFCYRKGCQIEEMLRLDRGEQMKDKKW